MGDKYSRSGGKFTGNHTTLIPLASVLCDSMAKDVCITRISPGFIKAGLPSVKGNRRLKITKDGAQILLTVRDNTSQQEIHVYADEIPSTVLRITKEARVLGMKVIRHN
jgi:hypothetical protein